MEYDVYSLFAESHRAYIQGIRNALQARLRSAYGDDWFQRGVLPAITLRQRENIDIALSKSSDDEVANLLDPGHFGYIIRWNHAAVFADAFPEIDTVLSKFRELAAIRNDWAHISPDALSLHRVAASIQTMKEILVALRCREALEIDTLIVQRNISKPDTVEVEQTSIAANADDCDTENSDQPDDLATAPLELWRTLQSYLVTEVSVNPMPSEGNPGSGQSGKILVTIRVSNVAPASEDRPQICFRDVTLDATDGQMENGRSLGNIEPGETVERNFTLPAKAIAQFEFQASGTLDTSRFFGMRHKGRLPSSVVRPVLNELSDKFEAIGIKEPLRQVMASLAVVQPTMTLLEAAQVREDLGLVAPHIEEKQATLLELLREFHLNEKKSPGSPMP